MVSVCCLPYKIVVCCHHQIRSAVTSPSQLLKTSRDEDPSFLWAALLRCCAALVKKFFLKSSHSSYPLPVIFSGKIIKTWSRTYKPFCAPGCTGICTLTQLTLPSWVLKLAWACVCMHKSGISPPTGCSINDWNHCACSNCVCATLTTWDLEKTGFESVNMRYLFPLKS